MEFLVNFLVDIVVFLVFYSFSRPKCLPQRLVGGVNRADRPISFSICSRVY